MTDKSETSADKKTPSRRRPRQIAVEVKEAIGDLVVGRGHTNKAEIYRALERMTAAGEPLEGVPLPGPWTVNREVDDILKRLTDDKSGPWSPASDVEAPPVILEALAEIVVRSEGRIRSISVAEAGIMISLQRLASDLDPIDLWHTARLYARRVAREEDVSDINTFLAFGPWRSEKARLRYYAAINSGWVQGLSPLDWVVLPLSSWMRGDETLRRQAAAMAAANNVPRETTVSNPVSNDARSATGRRRPKRPPKSSRQDMADGNE